MSDHPIKIDLNETLKECLERVPCFQPSDETFALHREKSILIGYNTNKKDPIASFNLQIDGHICYILDLEVREDSRRKGLGRQLFYAIQKFCLRRGCSQIQTTPSGMGKLFWPVMGFELMPPDFIGAVKHLRPIKDESEHARSLARIEVLMAGDEKKVEVELTELVESIVAYEEEWHPIGKPTPEEAAQFRKEQEA